MNQCVRSWARVSLSVSCKLDALAATTLKDREEEGNIIARHATIQINIRTWSGVLTMKCVPEKSILFKYMNTPVKSYTTCHE